MMLIGKSSDVQPVCLRTVDNAFPIYRHRNVGFSDRVEWRIEISMVGADLNGSPKILVRTAVIDRNHVAALQIRCDFVNPVERGLIKTRFINRPLDEYKLVAIETYQ